MIILTPCANPAIFGICPGPQMISGTTNDSIAFALPLLPCRRRLLEWKSAFLFKASLWLKDLMLFLNLEKMKYTLEKFETAWGSMINYIVKF